MSFSISDILKPLVGFLGDVQPISANKLYNPDIPTLNKYIKKFNDIIEIRDKAFSALKLTSQPRNGGDFRLPRTRFDDNPRKDNFLMSGAIDPNVIRKRVNPDKAIPSLESGESTKFSLVPENNKEEDFISLIQLAHKNYINYKNRFFVADPMKNEELEKQTTQPQAAGTQPQATTRPQTMQDIKNILNQLRIKSKTKRIGIPTKRKQTKYTKKDYNKFDDIDVGVKRKKLPKKKPITKPHMAKTKEFVYDTASHLNPNIFNIIPTKSKTTPMSRSTRMGSMPNY